MNYFSDKIKKYDEDIKKLTSFCESLDHEKGDLTERIKIINKKLYKHEDNIKMMNRKRDDLIREADHDNIKKIIAYSFLKDYGYDVSKLMIDKSTNINNIVSTANDYMKYLAKDAFYFDFIEYMEKNQLKK